MTEDASPENLRKFLKSDDLALVRMGLSMAKGAGVPDEMLMEILWMYMFHDDKTIRAAAKSTFIKFAPEDAKQAVKENWKASYRNSAHDESQLGSYLGTLGKALCQTSLGRMTEDTSENLRKFLESNDSGLRGMGLSMAKGSGVPEALYKNVFGLSLWDPDEVNREVAGELVKEIGLENIPEFPFVRRLINALEEGNPAATWALGEMRDARAVDPLIRALENPAENYVRGAAAEALGKIGKPAVEPLIGVLSDEKRDVRYNAIEALGEIGDKRAVEPLIGVLLDNDCVVRHTSGEALVKLGWVPDTDEQRAAYLIAFEDWQGLVEWGKPAVEPLIKLLEASSTSWEWGMTSSRAVAVKALGEIGDKRAVEPLIGYLSDDDGDVCYNAIEALGEIGDKRAVEPLIETLGNKSRYVRDNATEALGEIGDERAIEALIEALGNKSRYVCKGAAVVLDKLGWVAETDEQRAAYLIAVKDWKALAEWGEPAIEPLKALDLRWHGAIELGLLEQCKLLLSDDKILNLEQKEFTQIVDRISLETMESPCTDDIIGLLSGSSAQARWIVACGIVEISCYDCATIDKTFENPIDIFWSEISTYSDLITKTDRDEIINVLKRLPPVLISQIGKGLYNFALSRTSGEPKFKVIWMKNRKMITTVFEHHGLAKALIQSMPPPVKSSSPI